MNGFLIIGSGSLTGTIVGLIKFSDALDVAIAALIGTTVAYFAKRLYDKLLKKKNEGK